MIDSTFYEQFENRFKTVRFQNKNFRGCSIFVDQFHSLDSRTWCCRCLCNNSWSQSSLSCIFEIMFLKSPSCVLLVKYFSSMGTRACPGSRIAAATINQIINRDSRFWSVLSATSFIPSSISFSRKSNSLEDMSSFISKSRWDVGSELVWSESAISLKFSKLNN